MNEKILKVKELKETILLEVFKTKIEYKKRKTLQKLDQGDNYFMKQLTLG